MSVIEAPLTTETVTKRDVLHRAADIIEEFGWIQCSFRTNEKGDVVADPMKAVRFCALGAMGRACLDFGLEYRDRERFYGNPPFRSWMCFNDERGRTAQEVVAALREEAERA